MGNKSKQEFKMRTFFYFFLAVLGFKLRVSDFTRKVLYHLSHSISLGAFNTK
jgi:hypothetical protein